MDNSQLENNMIEVQGDSKEECLEEASKILDVSQDDLDYEVLQEGGRGLFGITKKKWRLGVRKISDDDVQPDDDAQDEPEEDPVTKDGKARVVVRKSGIFLHVYPPGEKGKPATIEDVNNILSSRHIRGVDKLVCRDAISKANGEPVKIGEYSANPDWDSKVDVEIEQDEMKALISVTKPLYAGRILEKEEILNALDDAGVKYGIRENNIDHALDNDLFDQPVVAAEGKRPVHGKDAKITFLFKTSHEDVALKMAEDSDAEDGDDSEKKIDYYESAIENVMVDQPLATKEPATMGNPGRTVTNQVIDPVAGKDIEFVAGEGAKLSEDGLQISAAQAGEAVFQRGEIRVEPVKVVNDVDFKTRNIVFLGSVIVKGSVQDGFSVQAVGDIEVHGNVGRSTLESNHDIIIKQGINGRNGAVIKAQNNVISKFIEFATVQADNDVIVAEDIISSNVDAGSRIICNGKKASIVGGHMRASQDIYTKRLGGPSYSETIVEAGVDFKSVDKLKELQEDRIAYEENLQKLKFNIKALEKQKEKDENLQPEKEQLLERSKKAARDFELQLQETIDDIEDIENYLTQLDNKGRVSSKADVYPGVKIRIKGEELQIREEGLKNITFINEGGHIKAIKFQELSKNSEEKK